MSSNNKKNKTNNNIKKDEIISSVVEMKPKDNRIVYFLCLVIIILISLLIYFIFINTSKTKCECDPIEKEVEVLPKHQLINFQGFKFQMPLDWSFVGKENSYEISNTDENLFIILDSLDEDYEVFKTDTYQKLFLEKIQTSSNTKIEHTNNYETYYYYEGVNNNYNYVIIAVGNSQKVILIKAQFIDKISFDKLKDSVIEFSTSIK